jgi:hypothetical protein
MNGAANSPPQIAALKRLAGVQLRPWPPYFINNIINNEL